MSSWDDGWIETELVQPGVADLIRTAQGAATADELAGEREIVARMRAAMSSRCDEETARDGLEALSPRRNRSTAVRLVAAKTAALVALVALGVAAAEATTGVVSAVFPDREPEVERQLHPVSTDPPKIPAPPGGSVPPAADPTADASSSPAERDDVDGADPDATNEVPGGDRGAGNEPAATGSSQGSSANSPTTTTSTTTPDAPAAEVAPPPPAQDQHGHAGEPPGQQDRPPRGQGRRDDP